LIRVKERFAEIRETFDNEINPLMKTFNDKDLSFSEYRKQKSKFLNNIDEYNELTVLIVQKYLKK
jgi:hypothetical protein